jgi:phosphate transport system substrate-binding protein
MRFQISVTLMLLAAGTLASSRIPTIRYRGGAQGRVVFDHQIHASKGLRCNACHTDSAANGKALFSTRKRGLITFADHSDGTGCFFCHDGEPADNRQNLSSSGKGAFRNCERCHYKGTAERLNRPE